MTREETIRNALYACSNKIDTVNLPFFYTLFGQVFQMGVDFQRGRITGEVQVYDSGGNSTRCDDIRTAAKKFNYSKKDIKLHLENGLPTPRGHVFKYA
jgi:hypothetical protein